MKLVGLMPVRNEAWCLGLSARVALQWCDELIIFCHASTDESNDISHGLMAEYGERIPCIIGDLNPSWDEMEHRQRLLQQARISGATHIAIIDADELLTANLLPEARDGMLATSAVRTYADVCGSTILQLPGYNLRGGINRYHANGIWGNRWFSEVFMDDPRLHWGGDKFHAREPAGLKLQPYRPVAQREGGIMHLWGASERRLKAKSAHYKMVERIRWPEKSVEEIDKMYSWAIHGDSSNAGMGTPKTWSFAETPASWWAPYLPLMNYLDVDAEPWQEKDCKRMLDEHGPEPFSRLDLFGVV